MRNYERILEENNEMYYELEELRSEVKHLKEELEETEKVLDSIEDILLNELDIETAKRIYKLIFDVDM